jgi:hypothetical protein
MGAAGAAGEPSEDELRAAYEAELSRITTTDMLAQTAVSLLNLGARKLGPPPGSTPPAGAAPTQPPGADRDLEQVRDAIDGAKALLDILDRRVPQELKPLRDALSQLQMAYAREVQATPAPPAQPAGAGAQTATAPAEPGEREPAAPAADGAGEDGKQQPPAPGPAESSGRLWVPGR